MFSFFLTHAIQTPHFPSNKTSNSPIKCCGRGNDNTIFRIASDSAAVIGAVLPLGESREVDRPDRRHARNHIWGGFENSSEDDRE
jgi:hypothetical protein